MINKSISNARVRLLVILAGVCLIGFSLPVVSTLAKVDPAMVKIDWPNNKRDLTFKFDEGVPDEIKTAFRAAANKWNDANTGWTIKETQGDNADIQVKHEKAGSGGFFQWTSKNGSIDKATITAYGYVGQTRVLMHEIGHAFRLAHEPDCGHAKLEDCEQNDSPCQDSEKATIMSPHQYFGDTDLTDTDKKEAKTTGKTGKLGKPQVQGINPSYGQRNLLEDHTIYENIGSPAEVQVIPYTPEHVTVGPVTWDSNAVYTSLTISSSALSHEGFDLVTISSSGDTTSYWGIVWVTDSPMPEDSYPNADAGADIIVHSGLEAFLDGSASWHDEPAQSITDYCWSSEYGNVYGNENPMRLPPGEHVVTLTVYDAWGQNASDSFTVTIPPVVILCNSLSYVWEGTTEAHLFFAICNPDPYSPGVDYHYLITSVGHIGPPINQPGTVTNLLGGECADVYGTLNASMSTVCDFDTLRIIAWADGSPELYGASNQAVHIVEALAVPTLSGVLLAIMTAALLGTSLVFLRRR